MELTLEQAKEMMDRNNGNLDLSYTPITSLPEGLAVGGGLNLRYTSITSLPEGLAVGGGLDLSYTQIKNKNEEIKKVKKLRQGEYKEGRYLFADGILTHVKKRRQIDGYTLYVGKIPGKNVVSDGVNYAHCDKLRDGIADLLFKSAANRGAEEYHNLSLDAKMTVPELAVMYRKITGACRQGTESFINSLKDLKEEYTIREAIEITKGQYNSERFSEFFRG